MLRNAITFIALGVVIGIPTGWDLYRIADGKGAEYRKPSYSASQRKSLTALISRLNREGGKKF